MELANPRKTKKKAKKRSSAKRPVKRVVKRRAAKRNPRRKVRRTAKRSSPRRTRKRKRPGHHKHTVRRHLRKVRGRKRRVAVKRHRSHETAAEAPRKPARRRRRRAARAREEVAMAAVNPRRRRKRRRARAREDVVVYEPNPRRRAKRRGKKRKGVRGRRRHTVRSHYRKPIRRRKATRSGKKRIHVKKHMSWEEQERNARRRKRKRARSARETIANPRKKKRRARRGSSRASVPAVLRKRVGGRSRAMPGKVIIQIAGLKGRSAGKRRGSAKRRSSKRSKRRGSRTTKRRSSKRRSGTTRKSGWSHYPPGYPRQYGGGYTGAGRQLPPASDFFENPRWDEGDMEGGALENPLSGGELALAFVTGGIGYALTDLLDRYLATSATPPAGMPNAVAVMTAPGLTRILAQAGFTALPFIGAYFVKQPMGRAALQGLGLGAGIHLVGQLIKSYVMAKALKSNDTGKRLYGDAIAANMLSAAAAGATGATGATGGATGATGGAVHGLPFGLGAPLLGLGGVSVPYGIGRAPARAYNDVGPRAGVGVGQFAAPAGAPYAPTTGVVPLGPHGPTPGGPAPGAPGGGGGGPCDPCAPSTEYQTGEAAKQFASVVASGETMQRTLEGAYSAAKDELCGRVGELPNAIPGSVPGTVGAPPPNGGARRKPFAIFPED